MAYFIPEEETLTVDELTALQRRRLAALLRKVGAFNPFYRRKLAGVVFDAPTDAICCLPFTTRVEIEDDQRRNPPWGTNLGSDVSCYSRYHQTSGTKGSPIRWLDTLESWEWCKRCWSIVYRAAGIQPSDRIAFTFSFGPFLGFWAAFDAAAALGNLCLPAGGMTTAARLRYLLDNEVTVICCTPTYALHLAEVAAAEGLALTDSKVRRIIVAGEPGGSLAGVRDRIESSWGARVIDHAGMTEVGPWGFECEENSKGMHIIESEFIAEVVDPASGEPAGEGEWGELVLTNLGRTASPLIRYRTGDHVRLVRGFCSCGRWFARAEGGILGRGDDMLIIRGNNVFPSAIEAILRDFPGVAEFRLVVESRGGMNEMLIEIESARTSPEASLAERIASTVRDRLHFRPEVRWVPAGSLPRYEMKAQRVVRPSP